MGQRERASLAAAELAHEEPASHIENFSQEVSFQKQKKISTSGDGKTERKGRKGKPWYYCQGLKALHSLICIPSA